MKTITINHTVVLLLVVLLVFFGAASFAFADHSGEEGESESHATTIHQDADHEDVSVSVAPIAVTISAGSDRAEKIQQLLTALQQLVALLQHQLEHMEADEHADDEDSADHHE
jgi:hypothetical protein